MGVQRSLLGLIETASVRLDRNRGRARDDDPVLDTTDVLFICGGSFAGLERFETEDLVAFGLMPELVGRLPVVVVLEKPDHAQLARILTEPRHSLVEQYRLLFRWSGVELDIRADGIDEIATRAEARGVGARGLRAVMERLLLDEMFDLPHPGGSGRIVVDRGFVGRRLGVAARTPSPPRLAGPALPPA
jgi:ATP-dependent Clp protease ATP-binding subunit ClpX